MKKIRYDPGVYFNFILLHIYLTQKLQNIIEHMYALLSYVHVLEKSFMINVYKLPGGLKKIEQSFLVIIPVV